MDESSRISQATALASAAVKKRHCLKQHGRLSSNLHTQAMAYAHPHTKVLFQFVFLKKRARPLQIPVTTLLTTIWCDLFICLPGS